MPKTHQHQKWGRIIPIPFSSSQKSPAVTVPNAVNSCSFNSEPRAFTEICYTIPNTASNTGVCLPVSWGGQSSSTIMTNVPGAPDELQVFLPSPQPQFLLSNYCSQTSPIWQYLLAALKAFCEFQFHRDFHGFELALDQALNIQIWDCVRI